MNGGKLEAMDDHEIELAAYEQGLTNKNMEERK